MSLSIFFRQNIFCHSVVENCCGKLLLLCRCMVQTPPRGSCSKGLSRIWSKMFSTEGIPCSLLTGSLTLGKPSRFWVRLQFFSPLRRTAPHASGAPSSGPDGDAGILPRSLDAIFSSMEGKVSTGPGVKPQRCREFVSLSEGQRAEEAAFKDNLLRHFKEVTPAGRLLVAATSAPLEAPVCSFRATRPAAAWGAPAAPCASKASSGPFLNFGVYAVYFIIFRKACFESCHYHLHEQRGKRLMTTGNPRKFSLKDL